MTEQHPAFTLHPRPSHGTYCRYIGTATGANYRTYRSTEEGWRQRSPGVMGRTMVLGLRKDCRAHRDIMLNLSHCLGASSPLGHSGLNAGSKEEDSCQPSLSSACLQED